MDAKIIDGPSSFTLNNEQTPFVFEISAPSMHTRFHVVELEKCENEGSWKIEGEGRVGSSEEIKKFSAIYNSETYTGTIKIEA